METPEYGTFGMRICGALSLSPQKITMKERAVFSYENSTLAVPTQFINVA